MSKLPTVSGLPKLKMPQMPGFNLSNHFKNTNSILIVCVVILILIALFKDGPLNEETHLLSGRYYIAELRGVIEFECKNDVFTELTFTRIEAKAIIDHHNVEFGDNGSTYLEFIILNGEGPNIRLWRLGGWHDGREFGKNYPKLVDFSERTGIRLSPGMLSRFEKWIP